MIFTRNATGVKAPGVHLPLDAGPALDSLEVGLSPLDVSLAGVTGPAALAQAPGVDQGETPRGHLLHNTSECSQNEPHPLRRYIGIAYYWGLCVP